MVAKRSAARLVTLKRPEVAARHSAACSAGTKRALEDPVKREALRQSGLKTGARNFWREQGPEKRAAAIYAIRCNKLAWCPEHYWPMNEELRKRGMLLAERQTIIADEVARAERRRIAALDPLERQLERLRNGAQLVPTFKPSRAGPDYTLGGVAPEAL